MSNKFKIIDSHSHYDDESFNEDREEVLNQITSNGVIGILNCASSYESLKATDELTKKYDYIYGALGIHPENANEMNDNVLKEIKSYIKENSKIKTDAQSCETVKRVMQMLIADESITGDGTIVLTPPNVDLTNATNIKGSNGRTAEDIVKDSLKEVKVPQAKKATGTDDDKVGTTESPKKYTIIITADSVEVVTGDLKK